MITLEDAVAQGLLPYADNDGGLWCFGQSGEILRIEEVAPDAVHSA